jgi:hypothetical protein
MKRVLACVSEARLAPLMRWLAELDNSFQIKFESTGFEVTDDSLLTVALFLCERAASESSTAYKLSQCRGYDHVLVDKQEFKGWEMSVPVKAKHWKQTSEFVCWPVFGSHRDLTV